MRSPSRLALPDTSLSALTPQLGMGGGLTEADWVELLIPQRKKEVQFDPPRMFCPRMFPVVAEAPLCVLPLEHDPGLSLWLKNGLPLRRFYV